MNIKKTILSLFFVSLAFTANAEKQPSSSSSSDYPFIVITADTVTQAPTFTDEFFYSHSSGVVFELNKSVIPASDAFLKKYRDEVLPMVNSKHLQLRKVYVRGAASPDGRYDNNQRLGRERSAALLKALRDNLAHQYIELDTDVSSVTEDYGYLCILMKESKDADYALVKKIYDECNGDELCCKKKLMAAKKGLLWKRLVKTYFPRLRSARVMLWFSKPDQQHAPVVEEKQPTIISKRDTIYVRDTVVVVNQTVIDNNSTIIVNHGTDVKATALPTDTVPRHPLLAIKTNLLFDVITALNASVEVPLTDYISLSAEVVWPWWVDGKNQWCMQMGNVGIEGRYYFRNTKRHSTHADWLRHDNRPLTGFFLGVHADGCYYDFEWKGSGRQGEAWAAGLTIGYQKRLSRYFNLEYSLGLGAARHKYRTYNATEAGDHLWRQKTYKNKTYLGPTKAKISLVWLLYSKCDKKCKKGGTK